VAKVGDENVPPSTQLT